jgi:hypothetical protein
MCETFHWAISIASVYGPVRAFTSRFEQVRADFIRVVVTSPDQGLSRSYMYVVYCKLHIADVCAFPYRETDGCESTAFWGVHACMGFPKEEIERSTIKHVHISVWQNIIKNVVHIFLSRMQCLSFNLMHYLSICVELHACLYGNRS